MKPNVFGWTTATSLSRVLPPTRAVTPLAARHATYDAIKADLTPASLAASSAPVSWSTA